MENLTDVLVSQILDSLDPSFVDPSREEAYFSFLICKNLSDLCETGTSILNAIQKAGKPITGLPEKDNITLCQNILLKFYSNNMFIPDEEYGVRPNWNAVSNFDKTKTRTAHKIYRAIRKNVLEKEDSKRLRDAIHGRNKDYFIKHFDALFKDIPFKEGLVKFKNFVNSPYVSEEHQKYVFDFFDPVLEIFENEKENIEDVSKL